MGNCTPIPNVYGKASLEPDGRIYSFYFINETKDTSASKQTFKNKLSLYGVPTLYGNWDSESTTNSEIIKAFLAFTTTIKDGVENEKIKFKCVGFNRITQSEAVFALKKVTATRLIPQGFESKRKTRNGI